MPAFDREVFMKKKTAIIIAIVFVGLCVAAGAFLLIRYLIEGSNQTLINPGGGIIPGSVFEDKPVIYLYPEVPTEVSVELEIDGAFVCTYPAYEDGWRVTAMPDGTLVDAEGKEYNYLFWEAESNTEYSMDRGFCVKGEEVEAFLEESLEKLGLTRREANEFIVYWLPKMQNNAYNLINFATTEYTDSAKLTVNPAPDTVIRVFMVYKALDEAVEIEAQTLETPERKGFTVVEWGGSEIK